MKKYIIKGLAYVIMFMLIIFIALPLSIFWNSYLIVNYIWVKFRRKTIAGIKEAKKTDTHK
jgi:hypothetical protein